MPVSNEEIYKKLDEIHKLLVTVEKEEEEVIKQEHKIEMEEEKLMKILGREVNKQFDSIMDWKRFIWEGCEFKEPVYSKEKIDFHCRKTGNACRFVDCPKNHSKKK